MLFIALWVTVVKVRLACRGGDLEGDVVRYLEWSKSG